MHILRGSLALAMAVAAGCSSAGSPDAQTGAVLPVATATAKQSSFRTPLELAGTVTSRSRADVGAADPLGSQDDDLATARLVIDGAADDGSAPCVPSEPDPHAPIPTVLRVEADAESARLALARRFAIGRQDADAGQRIA